MSRFKFREDVISKWQTIWMQVCDMAYERTNIVEELVVKPTTSIEEAFYKHNSCKNAEEISLDYTWKKYSQTHSDALVVPELKRIYVPRTLFECIGVYAWFNYSFPNCEIHFWETK